MSQSELTWGWDTCGTSSPRPDTNLGLCAIFTNYTRYKEDTHPLLCQWGEIRRVSILGGVSNGEKVSVLAPREPLTVDLV